MWWSFVGNAVPLLLFSHLSLSHVFLLESKTSKGIESSQFAFRPFAMKLEFQRVEAYYDRSRTYCTQMCAINRFIVESQTDFIFLNNGKNPWLKLKQGIIQEWAWQKELLRFGYGESSFNSNQQLVCACAHFFSSNSLAVFSLQKFQLKIHKWIMWLSGAREKMQLLAKYQELRSIFHSNVTMVALWFVMNDVHLLGFSCTFFFALRLLIEMDH